MGVNFQYSHDGGAWQSSNNVQSCIERNFTQTLNTIAFRNVVVPPGEVFTVWYFPCLDFTGTPVGIHLTASDSTSRTFTIGGYKSEINRIGSCDVGHCLDDSECPDGYHCSGGECIPDECIDGSDCGPCEKCVDGECVPCDECSDGLGQLILYCNDPINGDLVKVVDVDWSLPDQDNVNIGMGLYGYSYRLTCPKGFEDGIITLTEYWEETATGFNTDPVVRQVNTTKGSKYVDIQIADYFTRIDMFGLVPGFCSFTGKVHIGRVGDPYGTCADDLGPDAGEPLKPPPTEPPPTEPPGEPTGGDEPEEIDEPLPPLPVTPLPPQPQPPTPETGCECEIYQAKMILSGLQEVRNAIIGHQNQIDARLADGDSVLFARLTSMERTIYQQLAQTNRLLYDLSNWFGNNFFAELLKIRQAVETGLVKENKAVLESISDNLEFNDKGIAEILDGKDMVVFVENEERVSTSVYRTPDSHINISQMIE